jgi:hypothetical protein
MEAMTPVTGVGAPWYTSGASVKGNRCDLEGKTDEKKCPTGVENSRVQKNVLTQEVRDRREVGRSGRTVDEGRAVDEDGRGESTEQEILQGSLVRGRTVTVKANEHVEADGENLQSEEDDDEIVGLHHQERARARSERQDVKVRAGDALALGPVVGHECGKQHRRSDRHVANDGEPVQHDGVRHGRRRAMVRDVRPLKPCVDQYRDRGRGRDAS